MRKERIIVEKIKNLLAAGKHRRIEQFAVMFVALAVALVGVTVGCFAQYMGKSNEDLETTAVWGGKFTTSRTDVTGNVTGVYTSKDKTQALVLLKFEDMSNMSVDADNYQVFLTNAQAVGNGSELKTRPQGSIYMFGSSGYMGIYLYSTQGFQPQVLQVTVRCNQELKESDDSESLKKDYASDESFAKHDQFTLMVNPGASETKSLDCLDKGAGQAPTVKELYNQAVVKTEEADIHERLDDKLSEMKIALNKIDEYTNRLTNTDNMNVPEPPAAIKGDKIESKKDDNGKETLTLKPASVVPGGYDFDWRSRSVTDGWLDELIEKTDTPNMTYDQYFAEQNKAAKASKDSVTNFDIVWTFSDGAELASLNQESARYKQAQTDVNNLTSAWNEYYQAKVAYQRTLLGQLLELEAEASMVDSSASINTSKDVITCY